MTVLTIPPPLTGDVALFLDFDGTLVPLQDDPDSVHLSGHQMSCLQAISDRLLQAMAIVSGRDIRDLSRRVPESLWRAGSHGLEICAPGDRMFQEPSSAPASLIVSLQGVVSAHPGARLELKGEVLALHYRHCPHQEAPILSLMTEIMRAYPGYKVQSGKLVAEAKPVRANKGSAIETFLSISPFKGRVPVMLGDDKTDEDAMKVVSRLGGWSVKVGEGESLAQYRLRDTRDVWKWLSEGCL